MADHIQYTTDIPPLAPGADAVTSFLFGTRLGYCEQISTATVVMLRSLHIAARETVGYVPGPYDPITDLYDVQAKDAHAWVQVWFPGYGWQSFDPTAAVPAGQPLPGFGAGRHRWARPRPPPVDSHRHRRGRGRRLLRGPPAAAAAAAHLGPPDRRRPGPGGARMGRRRRVDETLSAYGRRLAEDDGAVRRRPHRLNPTGGALHLRRPRAVGRADRRRPGLHPWIPAGPPAKVTRRSGSRTRQGQRLVEGGTGGQQWTVGHQQAAAG